MVAACEITDGAWTHTLSRIVWLLKLSSLLGSGHVMAMGIHCFHTLAFILKKENSHVQFRCVSSVQAQTECSGCDMSQTKGFIAPLSWQMGKLESDSSMDMDMCSIMRATHQRLG